MINPRYIAIDLTYKCPLNCNFCFIKNKDSTNRNEIDIKYLKKLLKKLSGTKRHFYITGGEPFLKPWLPDFIYLLKKEGHTSLVTTNGLFLDRYLSKGNDIILPDEIVVSLHGKENIHDKICKKRGTFKKVIKSVTNLINSSQKVSVAVWCTINPYNYKSLYNFYLFISKISPDKIVFNHLEFISEKDLLATNILFKNEFGNKTSLNASESRVDKLDIKKLVSEIKKIKNHRDKKVRFFPDLSDNDIYKWYNPDITYKRKGFCKGQFDSLWISPYGDILSCQPLSYRLGRLNLSDPLSSVNSKKYFKFRKFLIKEGGFFPVCSRCGREPYTGGIK